MRTYLFAVFLSFFQLLLLSCGPSGRSGEAVTQYDEGDTGAGNLVISNITPQYTCEYFGYSTANNGNCIGTVISSSGVSTAADASYNLTDLNNDSSKWKSALAYMQVAEGNAYLGELGKSFNGDGVKIALVGSGVNQVADSLNLSDLSKNYGYLNTASSNVGEIYYDIVNPREADSTGTGFVSKSIWYDGTVSDSGALNQVAYDDYKDSMNICDSSTIESAPCANDVYSLYNYYKADENGNTETQLIDQDILTYGYNDVANGTNLASIMVKDGAKYMVGAASEAELISVKTQFIYNKYIYQYQNGSSSSFNDNKDDNWVLEDNTGKILFDAVYYAAAEAEADIILFNNHERSDDETGNKHPYFYKQDDTFPKSERSWSRIYNEATNVNFTSIKNILNDQDKIFITPVANILLADLIKDDTPSDGKSYDTFFAVADANIASFVNCSPGNDSDNCVIYADNNGKDQYNQNIIATITLEPENEFKNDFNCMGFEQDKCLIAPASLYALDSNGDYSLVDANEYSGSAYVAAIIAKLRSAYTEAELSNDDIVRKIFATTIAAENITGCGESNCGAGMINFYQIIRNINEATDRAINVAGLNYNLDHTAISLSGIFGDGFNTNSAALLSKAVFFDDYNFTYNAKLNDKVSNKLALNSALDSLISRPKYQISQDKFALKNISYDITKTVKNYANSKYLTVENQQDENIVSVNNFTVHGNLTNKLAISVALSADYDNKIGKNNGNISATKGYASLHEENSDILASKLNLTDNLTIDNILLKSDNALTNITNFTLHNKLTDKLALSFGYLKETDAILGSKTSGAFGDNSSANTKYVNLQLLHNVADIELYGSLSFGNSEVSNRNSILSDFSTLKTRELQISATKKAKNGNFGLAYIEPLRVTSGQATLTVPVARDVANNIYYEDARLSFATLGKERNYEFFINYDLATKSKLKLNLAHIKDYGHIKGNDNSLIALSFNKLF